MYEFDLNTIQAKSQVKIPVDYKGKTMCDYFADIVVENKIMIRYMKLSYYIILK